MGLPRRSASVKASGPHSCQSTGLSLCCRRYGLVEPARRLTIPVAFLASPSQDAEPLRERNRVERSMDLHVVVEVDEHLALAHRCRRAQRATLGGGATHLPGADARGP